jgi:hypothetical protein
MARRVHEFETSRFSGRAEITGFRDGGGDWNHLSGGRWYTGQPSEAGSGHRHHGRSPNDLDLSTGREFSVHIRYRGRDYFYTYHTPRGVTGELIEADFRARIRAGYFRRHGSKR